MKKLRFIFCFLAAISFLSLQAQSPKKKFVISFNYGTKGLISELNENWPIRQDVSYYYNYGNNARVNIMARLNYFGVSPEFFFLNNKLSVASGLRFTNLYSDITKPEYDNSEYFFLRIKSDGSNTDYARVRTIKENVNFLGVPLEIKYIPFDFDFISFYVKLSGELAYKINSATDIVFKEPEMEQYQSAVLSDLNVKTNPLYASIYASIGSTVRFSEKLFCSLDVFFPSFYTTEKNSGLVNITNISGVQISLTVPF